VPELPACAVTAQTFRFTLDGSGTTWVHVAPRSWLTATPQSVPTKTSFAPAANAIPHVLVRELQKAPDGGFAVGGFCQVAPPSVLRQTVSTGCQRLIVAQQIHQRECEVIEYVDSRHLRVKLDGVEQHGLLLDQHDIRKMQIAVATADKTPAAAFFKQGTGVPE